MLDDIGMCEYGANSRSTKLDIAGSGADFGIVSIAVVVAAVVVGVIAVVDDDVVVEVGATIALIEAYIDEPAASAEI